MFKRVFVIVAALAITTQAEARSHHHAHHMHVQKSVASSCVETFNIMQPCAYQPNIFAGIQTIRVKLHKERVEASPNFYQSHALSYASTQIVSHPAGCPRSAFCGCGAAVHVFGRPVRDLYLAANWYKFPRTSPAPGAVAVRRHHVFVIEAVLGNGVVMAYDANSGHGRTQIHSRSIAGYTIVNPHG